MESTEASRIRCSPISAQSKKATKPRTGIDLPPQRGRRGLSTIENCLRHIATVEWWYITRLDIDIPTDFPRDPFDLLQYTRRTAEKELKRLTKEQRTRIFQPHNDPSPVCNL